MLRSLGIFLVAGADRSSLPPALQIILAVLAIGVLVFAVAFIIATRRYDR